MCLSHWWWRATSLTHKCFIVMEIMTLKALFVFYDLFVQWILSFLWTSSFSFNMWKVFWQHSEVTWSVWSVIISCVVQWLNLSKPLARQLQVKCEIYALKENCTWVSSSVLKACLGLVRQTDSPAPKLLSLVLAEITYSFE